MAARPEVTPNRRGTRSREAVLDAAERVMAKHGYEAATIARIVDESGIPLSSVYHYFGSKDGVLLAVMERGAERFFDSLPDIDSPVGGAKEHLQAGLGIVAVALDEHPDFLRLLIVMTAQPPAGEEREVHQVVERVREMALVRLRRQMQLAFGLNPRSKAADRLARFALASFDGAYIAQQGDEDVALGDILGHLPTALVAIHEEIR